MLLIFRSMGLLSAIWITTSVLRMRLALLVRAPAPVPIAHNIRLEMDPVPTAPSCFARIPRRPSLATLPTTATTAWCVQLYTWIFFFDLIPQIRQTELLLSTTISDSALSQHRRNALRRLVPAEQVQPGQHPHPQPRPSRPGQPTLQKTKQP